MRRVVWAIARRSFVKGTRLKTQMSKATLWVSLLFIFFFVCYLVSYFFPLHMVDSSQPGTKVLLINSPASFETFLEKRFVSHPEVIGATFLHGQSGAYYDFLTYQDKLSEKDVNLVIIFPEDFDVQIAGLSGDARPQILTYYNPSDTDSKLLHDVYTTDVFINYGDYLQAEHGRVAASAPVFSVFQRELTGIQPDESIFGSKRIISHMILPLILFIAVMYACMESGTVSIAGEKERGTFAAILLTPVRRIEIVLGNALGILMHAMIPSTVVILLFTALFGYFSIGTIAYLMILCLSLSLLMTVLVLIISIMNRSILAAQASFLPIFFILLIVCITAMQEEGTPPVLSLLLPFYGHYYGIAAALDGSYSISLLLILCGICAVITALLIIVSNKLLHIERFTTYADDNQDIRKELRRKTRDRIMFQKAEFFPQNTVYGYHPKRSRSAVRLLIYQLLLPVYLLAFFQLLALIAPVLLYLRSDASTVFFTELSKFSGNLFVPAGMVLKLFAELMQTKSFVFTMGVSYFLVIAVYLFIIRVFEKNPASSAGLPVEHPRAFRKIVLSYGRGLAIGLGMMLCVFLILLLTGQISVGGIGLDSSAAGLFVIYILMWIPQGACEELMFRGYMLPRLSARFGRAAAVFLTSLSFSLLHMGNAGFSVIAFGNLMLISVFFALLALQTQEIWTVCAAHSIWNFAQGNLFGLEVSGTQSAARLIQTNFTGSSNPLLTGGNFGPEGGLPVTAVIVLCLLILLIIRHKLDKTIFTGPKENIHVGTDH